MATANKPAQRYLFTERLAGVRAFGKGVFRKGSGCGQTDDGATLLGSEWKTPTPPAVLIAG